MKSIFFLGAVFLVNIAFAAEPQVSVNIDGQVYQCTIGGGTTDPNCVKEVTGFCSGFTSHSSNDCFNRATDGCKGAKSGFAKCVNETATYCYGHTSMSANDCFARALTTCK